MTGCQHIWSLILCVIYKWIYYLNNKKLITVKSTDNHQVVHLTILYNKMTNTEIWINVAYSTVAFLQPFCNFVLSLQYLFSIFIWIFKKMTVTFVFYIAERFLGF